MRNDLVWQPYSSPSSCIGLGVMLETDNLTVCPVGCVAVWLSGCLTVRLSACLSVWLSGWLSVCLAVCLSGCLTVRLTV